MVTITQRWRLDIIMTIGLICCMSYSLIGKALHEWIGTAVLALFVLHLVRNRRWFTSLRRGRWNGARVLGSVLCGLVCFVTLGLIVSSLMLSEYVFAFLPLGLPEGVGQTPHQVCAYWGFFSSRCILDNTDGLHRPCLRSVFTCQRVFGERFSRSSVPAAPLRFSGRICPRI